MEEKNDLTKVKANLDSIVGKKIRLTSKKGRKKVVIKNGIIEQTFPSIFVVRLDACGHTPSGRRISYSYSDVLTKAVELSLCVDNEELA